ncbi:hypothetical protein BKA82DRAFT_11379 [Pisolithus tinctorius]|uniref:Uncharacterized protein n=1 Tax=Pisolithus tinctorius Marx 270 TaxID=870435 RepID=A0A0C3ND10_PISTI|nr:hypothetical protein BKA82DRAFT_11379 [Pisolithus tinctorius]KIN93715.1 hypothetical protein M404DRAFT_11379 [Pisolithus tinctorius Marx 270]
MRFVIPSLPQHAWVQTLSTLGVKRAGSRQTVIQPDGGECVEDALVNSYAGVARLRIRGGGRRTCLQGASSRVCLASSGSVGGKYWPAGLICSHVIDPFLNSLNQIMSNRPIWKNLLKAFGTGSIEHNELLDDALLLTTTHSPAEAYLKMTTAAESPKLLQGKPGFGQVVECVPWKLFFETTPLALWTNNRLAGVRVAIFTLPLLTRPTWLGVPTVGGNRLAHEGLPAPQARSMRQESGPVPPDHNTQPTVQHFLKQTVTLNVWLDHPLLRINVWELSDPPMISETWKVIDAAENDEQNLGYLSRPPASNLPFSQYFRAGTRQQSNTLSSKP